MPNVQRQNGIKKPVRSRSGVTPLTVVLPPKKCNHGTCIYCPGGDDVPQSYTDKSPAVMRAMALGFDVKKQVKVRLDSFLAMGHPTEKIELIIIGGTFMQYPWDFCYNYVKDCFDVLNGKESETLKEAQKINETATHRIVALCIENRPDNCTLLDIKRMRELGATRVELGVQILDDEIYKKINRGHSVLDVTNATKNLRDAGFKIGYHIMPGLPYSNFENDLEKFKLVFSDSRFRPDQLKLYPCQIVEGSPLAKNYQNIGYVPYSSEDIKKILTEMISLIPEYCRIMRVMREIPKEKMKLEAARSDMRKEVEDGIKKNGIFTKEIRMREVGFNSKDLNTNTSLKILEYGASGGLEYFLEVSNPEGILFGLLRLRIVDGKAIIREVHVYGQSLDLGKKGEFSQHLGMGKELILKAEEIVRGKGISKLSVISGVGVREYYRKLGYFLKGTYMIKELD